MNQQLQEIKALAEKHGSHEVPLWFLFNGCFFGDDRESQAKKWAAENGLKASFSEARMSCAFFKQRQ